MDKNISVDRKAALSLGLTPVVIYVRVSSEEQSEGFSIPAQIELLVDYARRNSMRIVRIFEEAQSAKDSGRAEFNRMLHYLKTHTDVNTILVEKTDRLYRNFKDYAAIDDNKYCIHLVKEGEILSKDSTSHQKLVHGLKVLLAKNFIDNLREETYKGRKKKASEGYIISATPYGYKKVDSKTSVIIPEQAQFIRAAFQYYLEEGSLGKTAERLWKDKIIYRPTNPRIGRGNLYRILTTVTVAGYVQFEGELYPAKHEAIISKELFDKVQIVLKKERYYKRDYLFVNFIKCARCGGSIVPSVRGKDIITYSCAGRPKGCRQAFIALKEDYLEAQVIRAFKRVHVTEGHRRWIINELKRKMKDVKYVNTDQRDAYEAELERIKQQQSMLYDDKAVGAITKDFWAFKNSELELEKEKIKEKMNSLIQSQERTAEEVSAMLDICDRLVEMWKHGGYRVQRILLGAVFKRITLKGRLLSFEYNLPFAYFTEPWDVELDE